MSKKTKLSNMNVIPLQSSLSDLIEFIDHIYLENVDGVVKLINRINLQILSSNDILQLFIILKSKGLFYSTLTIKHYIVNQPENTCQTFSLEEYNIYFEKYIDIYIRENIKEEFLNINSFISDDYFLKPYLFTKLKYNNRKLDKYYYFFLIYRIDIFYQYISNNITKLELNSRLPYLFVLFYKYSLENYKNEFDINIIKNNYPPEIFCNFLNLLVELGINPKNVDIKYILKYKNSNHFGISIYIYKEIGLINSECLFAYENILKTLGCFLALKNIDNVVLLLKHLDKFYPELKPIVGNTIVDYCVTINMYYGELFEYLLWSSYKDNGIFMNPNNQKIIVTPILEDYLVKKNHLIKKNHRYVYANYYQTLYRLNKNLYNNLILKIPLEEIDNVDIFKASMWILDILKCQEKLNILQMKNALGKICFFKNKFDIIIENLINNIIM